MSDNVSRSPDCTASISATSSAQAKRCMLRLAQDGPNSFPTGQLLAHPAFRHASKTCENLQFKKLRIVEPQVPDASRSTLACVLPPTRLTLRPTSTAGFWP